jgi:hypothetical protein
VARHAVFTIVQDDPVNLRIWASYYRKTYEADDTYVLHHPTVGERWDSPWIMSTSGEVAHRGATRGSRLTFQLVPVYREESFNHTWLRETVQHFQRFLLQSYDTVLFTEVDEIVVPMELGWHERDKPRDFREYLDAIAGSDRPFIRCSGFEIVHDYVVEPPIDFTRPLLAQRAKGYWAAQYNKTLLAKVPLTWVNGFHDLAPPARSGTPDLRLILLHLHKLDFPTALERHRRSAAQKWSRHDKATKQGIQNQIADEAWLRNWWYDTVDRPGERARLVPIPEGIKEAF